METDLGEYIVQLAEQRPYHIVTPAMHLSKADIAAIFVKHLGIEHTDDAGVTTVLRESLPAPFDGEPLVTSSSWNPSANPLLAPWSGPYSGVPPFDQIRVEHFKPALEAANFAVGEEVELFATHLVER